MRRFVAALVVISVGFALAACGGDTSTTNTTNAAASTPPPAAAPAGLDPNVDTKSPTEEANGEPFPVQVGSVPTVVLENLKAKRPMFILYYDSTQLVTDDQRAEVDAVMAKYRGLIELIAYDVRTGEELDAASQDPEIAKAMEMAGLLDVKYQPYSIFVDRYGRITGRFSGFVDEQLLEREVLRATS
jgi:hypothetical protein